jgi:hypothetical protein
VASEARASDVNQVIAGRPWTVTVHRETAHEETLVDTFTGRIDEISRRSIGLEISTNDGIVSLQVYVLICPEDHRTVQARDIVAGVDEYGQMVTFRCLSADDYGYKLEAILERLE